jgi:hypothetical protein
MILASAHYDDPRHPSIYDAITGWASHAGARTLAVMAVAGLVDWAALFVADWRLAPAAAILLTLSAVSAWGLLEQRATSPQSVLRATAQSLLFVAGTVAAVVSGFALLFWVMGPAPVL